MKPFRIAFASLIIFACLAFLAAPTGCASRLESGGAYAKANQAPDKAFFAVDSAFDIAYSAVDTVFKFEKNNRTFLWQISPEIKHTLDKLRPQAKAAVITYGRARSAYLANPTPAGLTTLQTTLSEMQRLASTAQEILPKQ